MSSFDRALINDGMSLLFVLSMNIVTNRLRNALLTVPKYNLLPNSDYTCKRKLNPILNIKLNSERQGPLGSLRVKVAFWPYAAI